MGKQPKKEDEEMETIMDHLDRQDKTLHEILILLRGSVSLGVEGIVSKQSDFEDRLLKLINEVAHYERWRQKQIENRGKITISIGQLFTRILALIGGIGTLIGLLLGFKQLLEQQ